MKPPDLWNYDASAPWRGRPCVTLQVETFTKLGPFVRLLFIGDIFGHAGRRIVADHKVYLSGEFVFAGRRLRKICADEV